MGGEYRIRQYPALRRPVERCQVKTDQDGGIVNDPNHWRADGLARRNRQPALHRESGKAGNAGPASRRCDCGTAAGAACPGRRRKRFRKSGPSEPMPDPISANPLGRCDRNEPGGRRRYAGMNAVNARADGRWRNRQRVAGGSEFCIALPDGGDIDSPAAFGVSICYCLRQPIQWSGCRANGGGNYARHLLRPAQQLPFRPAR